MPPKLTFFTPQPVFPSVSITGTRCQLMCKHCRAHYLEGMVDVSTPERLREFCVEHEARGGVGVLVSGGSTREGRVPLRPFLGALQWVKENTGLVLNLHTGMLSQEEAQEVASTGVDVVSVDLVGSEDTLRQVYGLGVSVEEYGETLVHLVEAGVSVAPHVCVGLHFGEVRGERRALEQASQVNPEVVVLISLIPTPGTPMADVEPPTASQVAELVGYAAEVCPGSEVALGCMRSRRSKEEVERMAIQAGASRIAMASRATMGWALERGYQVERLGGCCALPPSILGRLPRL